VTNFRILGIAAVILILQYFLYQPTHTFKESVLESVVSVLPNWAGNLPKDTRNKRPEAPEGTAIAILPGGYLMTNSHVLGTAREIDIRLNDGKILAVEIVGRDLRTDLALLKAPVDFPIIKSGVAPKLGDHVCSVGNQFGLGLSATCGVVSATHRTGTGFNIIEDFVQTDTVVNPGGSGGALVDKDNNLVGMISAIFTKSSDANIGINFATAAPLLTRVAEDLRDYGRVLWGKSGMRIGALTTEERRHSSGSKIIHIIAGGGAEKAGLKIGDIITDVSERMVVRPTDVASALAQFRPGDTVDVIYFRKGQKNSAEIILSQ
jgi:S1-C subfamily serine protease